MLKIDLRDFFHHFDEAQVYDLLKRTEYSALVRLEIARIVTRQPNSVQKWLPKKYGVPTRRRDSGYFDIKELSDKLFDFNGTESECPSILPHSQGIFLGYLPQGSPSSGAISNLLARPLDVDLTDYAHSEQLIYTRYADDIVFSSSGPFTHRRAVDLLHGARRIIRRHGLEPHDGKTKVVGPGLPLELLGIRVDRERLQLAARFRKRIDFHLRGISVFGAAGHSKHCGFDDAFGMERHLRGLIRYTHDVDADLAARYFQQLEEALRSRS